MQTGLSYFSLLRWTHPKGFFCGILYRIQVLYSFAQQEFTNVEQRTVTRQSVNQSLFPSVTWNKKNKLIDTSTKHFLQSIALLTFILHLTTCRVLLSTHISMHFYKSYDALVAIAVFINMRSLTDDQMRNINLISGNFIVDYSGFINQAICIWLFRGLRAQKCRITAN